MGYSEKGLAKRLMSIYDALYAHFGPQYWWPADTDIEMIVGAILTQNTAWTNVEKALAMLRKYNALEIETLYRLPEQRLATLIQSSGFFQLKARRLKALIHFIFSAYEGSLIRMFAESPQVLRERLLGVNGVGPETADSILLYAGRFPIFVVDAYTRRVFLRHHLIRKSDGYRETQASVMRALPQHVPLFNEYHALLVRVAKTYCKKGEPNCEACPLNRFL